MQSAKCKRLSVKGFTLIELLVVVAIIAVLIAILLPALSRARDVARIAVCGARLQQIGVAIQMYVNEHSDRLLARTNGMGSGVWAYAPGPPGSSQIAASYLGILYAGKYITDHKVFFCPDQRDCGYGWTNAEDTFRLNWGKAWVSGTDTKQAGTTYVQRYVSLVSSSFWPKLGTEGFSPKNGYYNYGPQNAFVACASWPFSVLGGVVNPMYSLSPHGLKGWNVLYLDGSVRFRMAPPPELSFYDNVVNISSYYSPYSDDFWTWVERPK